MLTCDDVNAILREHLPPGVNIRLVDRDTFVARARIHPYVQQQIDRGIYDNDTFADDFLSFVCSYVPLQRVDLCYDQLVRLAESVPDHVVSRFVEYVARHEAHHFAQQPAHDLTDHGHQEIAACQAAIADDTDLATDVATFERLSPMYHRVLDRVARMP